MDHDHSKRPLGVNTLIAVVLIFTSLNIVRVISATKSWSFLSSLPLQIPAIYFIISGTIWSLLGTILVFGLILRKMWTLPLTMILCLGYSAFYWFDRLFIASRAVNDSHWQFAVGLTILSIIIMIWILTRQKTKSFLNK